MVKDYSTQSSSCSAQIKVDMLPPNTTDDYSGSGWRSSDQTIKLTCSDAGGSGCAQIQYCVEPCDISTGTVVSVSDASPSTEITVCPAETDCEKTITYRSKDNAGSLEDVKSTNRIQVDKSILRLYSVSAVPTPFSPNLDGVKDALAISFSTDQETDGMRYNATITISPAGLSSVVRTLIKDKAVGGGAHTELWNGSGDNGELAADGAYSYMLTLTDRAGNRNSSSGEVRIDLTPPEFVQQGASSSIVELGEQIIFSATFLDSSGIDSVFVCGSSENCRDGGALCRMENTSQYRDRFSCTFTPPAIGTYSYYIFANDTQNLFSNASGSFRVRTTTISAPSVSPPIVDLQSNVRIEVNYTENGTYPVDGATCTLSGGLGGTFPASSNPHYIELRPPKPERIDFVATCSKDNYPSRSASGYFTGRELDIVLSYDDVPLAANYTNYLYASVGTINDYSPVNVSADVHTFSISGPESFSGNMEWNGSIGRWVANFTPTKHGAYSARVDFKKDGIDGTSSISMGSEKSLEVSFSVPTTSLSVDLGSSLLLKMSVTNKGSKGRVYNITLKSAVGTIYPVSFDGEPLSGKRHSTVIFVPADTTQEHIILVKGMEVSPFERSFTVRAVNVEKPNIFEEREVKYKVSYSTSDQRKVAPDLDATAVLLLLGFGILYMRSNLPLACRQKNSRK